jgi:hypothetical protein
LTFFKAFDSYNATIGIPMEKRIPEPSDKSTMIDCVKELVESNAPLKRTLEKQ